MSSGISSGGSDSADNSSRGLPPSVKKQLQLIGSFEDEQAQRLIAGLELDLTKFSQLYESGSHEIATELREAIERGKIPHEYVGAYYRLLQEMGIKLDPLDEVLQVKEFNIEGVYVREDTPKERIAELCLRQDAHHSAALRHARLAAWAQKVLVENKVGNIPSISSAAFSRVGGYDDRGDQYNIDLINNDLHDDDNYEEDEEPQSKEQEYDGLMLLVRGLSGSVAEGPGLYTLYSKQPRNRRPVQVTFSYNLINNFIDEIYGMYEAAAQSPNRPPPLASDNHVEAAVGLLIRTLAAGVEQNIIAFYYLHWFLMVIERGIKTDNRFASAVVAHKREIAVILDAEVNRILAYPVENRTERLTEAFWEVLQIVTATVDRLTPSLQNEEMITARRAFDYKYNATEVAVAELLAEINPILLRCVEQTDDPYLCTTAAEVLDTAQMYDFTLPGTAAISIVNAGGLALFERILLKENRKHSVSAPVDQKAGAAPHISDDAQTTAEEEPKEDGDDDKFDNDEADAAVDAGAVVKKKKRNKKKKKLAPTTAAKPFKPGGKPGKGYKLIMTNIRTKETKAADGEALLQHDICSLLVHLVQRGHLLHDAGLPTQQVITGPIGAKLLKRGILPLLLDLLKEDTPALNRTAVECLNQLTRIRDSRALLFMHEKEETGIPAGGLIPRILGHEDVYIVSDGLMIVAHLLWDKEWQPYLHSLQPGIEVYAARFAVAAITAIERETEVTYRRARIQWKVEKLLESRQASKNKLVELKKSADWILGVPQNDVCDTIPPKVVWYPKDQSAPLIKLLGRCMIVLSHFSPLYGISSSTAGPRLRSIHGHELLAAACDTPVAEMAQHASSGLANFAYDPELFVPEDVPSPKDLLIKLFDFWMGRHPEFRSSKDAYNRAALVHSTVRFLAGITNLDKMPQWKPITDAVRQHYTGTCNKYELEKFEANFEFCKNYGSEGEYNDGGAQLIARNDSLNQMQYLNSCASCGKVAGKSGEFKKCSQCLKVAYCSRDCQKAHWKTHKGDCIKHASAAADD